MKPPDDPWGKDWPTIKNSHKEVKHINESSPPKILNKNLGLDRLNIFGASDSSDHKEIKNRRTYEPRPIDDNKISETTAPKGPPKLITFGSLVW